MPGHCLAGVVRTGHQHGRQQIPQQIFLFGSKVVGRVMGYCTAIDLHYLLERRSFQGNKCGPDFGETRWWKPASRIFLQQDAAGLKLDEIERGSFDDGPVRRSDRPGRVCGKGQSENARQHGRE
jgi:hypothetical protein